MIRLESGEYMFRVRHYFADQTAPRHLEADSIVLDNRLYFPSPSQMNDPLEATPKLKWSKDGAMTRAQIREMIKRQAPTMRFSEQFALRDTIWHRTQHPDRRASFRQSIADWLSASFLGSSLCSFFPQLDYAKWATYGDTGRGYALVFRRSTEWVFDVRGQHFVGDAPLVRMRVLPIEYSETYPEIDLDMDWYESENGWEAIRRGLLTKLDQWKHENELRVIRPGVPPSGQPFRPESLVGVIAGHKASDQLVDHLLALSRKRRSPISVYRSVVEAGLTLPAYEQVAI